MILSYNTITLPPSEKAFYAVSPKFQLAVKPSKQDVYVDRDTNPGSGWKKNHETSRFWKLLGVMSLKN